MYHLWQKSGEKKNKLKMPEKEVHLFGNNFNYIETN